MESIVFRIEESLAGKSNEKCLYLSPKDLTNQNCDAYTYELNTILSKQNWSLVVISMSGDIPAESLERFKALVTKSKSVRAAVIWESPATLIFSKTAWDSLGPFASKNQVVDMWKDFIFRGSQLRLFQIFEFNRHPDLKSSHTSKSASREFLPTSSSTTLATPASFNALNTTLDLRELLPQAPISISTKETLRSEVEISAKLETAVSELQKENNELALHLINEVIPYRQDMHALYYAKAVAETRLGLKDEALKSLTTLLAKDPSSEEGRKLLKHLQGSS